MASLEFVGLHFAFGRDDLLRLIRGGMAVREHEVLCPILPATAAGYAIEGGPLSRISEVSERLHHVLPIFPEIGSQVLHAH